MQSVLFNYINRHKQYNTVNMVNMCYRCHYTIYNLINDHSSICLKKPRQKKHFNPLGQYTCKQCSTSYLYTVKETLLSHISFSDLQWQPSDSHKMSVAIFTQDINKWQMSL